MTGDESQDEELEARVVRAVAGSRAEPDVASLIERARRLDARLAELHAALTTTRSVEGYELARDIAAERDGVCARIGLWVVRSKRALVEPGETATTAPVVHDEPASDAPPAYPSDAREERADEHRQSEPQRASPEEVSSFVARMSKTGLGTGAALAVVPPSWPALLDRLLARVGAPPIDDTEAAVDEEVDLLAAATTRDEIENWTRLPSELQREFVSMLVARLSRLRDSRLLSEPQAGRLREVVALIQSYTREHRTGHINGLALRHRPVAPTWGEDALHYWEELQGRLDTPVHNEPSARRKPTRETDHAEERSAVPDGWPHRALVEGKAAILIGGEPREVNRARLERAFGLRQLEWISSKNPRRHDAIVDAVAAGGVDVVFMVKNLISHSILEKLVAACDEAHVGYAVVDGYGSAALIRGVERYLARRSVA